MGKINKKSWFLLIFMVISPFLLGFALNTYISSNPNDSSTPNVDKLNQINKLDDKDEMDEIDKPKTSIEKNWSLTYGGSGIDQGNNVANDTNGNIYLAARVYNAAQLVNMSLRKYNSAGGLEWDYTINGLENQNDTATSVAVDSNNNFVYFAGYIKNRVGYTDMFLISYTLDGTYQWNRTWIRGSTLDSYGMGVVVDNSGNIYVGGFTAANELFIAKYDSSGTSLDNFTGTPPGNEIQCKGLAIDSNEYLYLLGFNKTTIQGHIHYDTLIWKFSNSLVSQWNETYSYHNMSVGESICTKSNNYIYICGYDGNTPTESRNWSLVIYDSSGNYISNKTYQSYTNNFDYYAEDVEVDEKRGKIYLVGKREYDIIVLACDINGNYLWNWTWDSGEDEKAYGACLDDTNGILCIIGRTDVIGGGANYDVILLQVPLTPEFPIFTVFYANNPDEDGDYEFDWHTGGFAYTDDIDNYSLYEDSSYISAITGGETILLDDTTDMNYIVNDKTDGIYYYILEAHNIYGNTLSNCYQVNVVRSPGPFSVSHNASTPFDNDGVFWLNWSDSESADNYSIYYNKGASMGDSPEGYDLYQEGIETNKTQVNLPIPDSDTYYIQVVAYKHYAGGSVSNKSNEIFVIIGLPPGSSTISSHFYENPDRDGAFFIDWTVTIRTDNYSLYWSDVEIADVNVTTTVYLLYNGSWLSSGFYTDEWADGTYYFRVFSNGTYGSTGSTNLTIVVKHTVGLPPSSDDDDDDDDDKDTVMPWYIQAAIGGVISATAGIIIKQTYSSTKKRRIFLKEMRNQFSRVASKEAFLQEKLGTNKWKQLEHIWIKFKNQKINDKEFLKQGKKALGRDFTNLFTTAKVPKKKRFK